MDTTLRNLVRDRAQRRCEYCRAREELELFTFHCDHVVAPQHGGATTQENLAWCCFHCNLHKGPNLSGIDPVSGDPVALFNPRLHAWADHFVFNGPMIIGRTAIGRATVRVLDMNAAQRVQARS